MGKIGEEVCRLVMEYGGAMSGEHGDGLARGKFNKVLFGPKIYQAFRETKALFDPHNIFNPGKVVETTRTHRKSAFWFGLSSCFD